MQHLLSTRAQLQLAAYKRTHQIDATEELFNEVYELIVNNADSCATDEQVYDMVMQSINKL